MNPFLKIISGIVLALAVGYGYAAVDVDHGKALYQTRCTACHSIDYNGVGPAHHGVFGRKAATQSDYAYSPALKATNIVWTEKTLGRWLSNPEKLVPGQKMGFSVADPLDRADIIAYLKAQSATKP